MAGCGRYPIVNQGPCEDDAAGAVIEASASGRRLSSAEVLEPVAESASSTSGGGGFSGRLQEGAVPQGKTPARCLLPKEGGMCMGYGINWYWSTGAQRCLPFVYGLCGGNDNRFDSAADCLRACDTRNGMPRLRIHVSSSADEDMAGASTGAFVDSSGTTADSSAAGVVSGGAGSMEGPEVSLEASMHSSGAADSLGAGVDNSNAGAGSIGITAAHAALAAEASSSAAEATSEAYVVMVEGALPGAELTLLAASAPPDDGLALTDLVASSSAQEYTFTSGRCALQS
mmetsp:Transcript_17617/g.52919  ORF Transcript_17617/g.52919 Transcript_17617/m.52919 type:complete len:286 (+) Transcript_17617:3415-4272(+)